MRTPEEVLAHVKTIAVVGLSPEPAGESYTVAAHLQQHGYKIIPVNPTADSVLGEKCCPTLRDVPVAVDLVDIFRRPEFTPALARDAWPSMLAPSGSNMALSTRKLPRSLRKAA